MRTVRDLAHWVDDNAEDLIGLPVAEAAADVLAAGYAVELRLPDRRHVPHPGRTGVAITGDRRGVVIDVRRTQDG